VRPDSVVDRASDLRSRGGELDSLLVASLPGSNGIQARTVTHISWFDDGLQR